MKRVVLFLMLLMIGLVAAVPATNISFYYSVSCSHCEAVIDSGVLDEVGEIGNVSLERYEITSPVNREKYLAELSSFGVEDGGIPFLVIERGAERSYIMGDETIINSLRDSVLNFEAIEGGYFDVKGGLNLWVVVVAALIDSINPCAFGVLLFLMAFLLSVGSSRRAFRSGLIYTGVIFLVYLAAGFGIMAWASDFLTLGSVRLFVGVLVLIGALIEIKDFFWDGKGFSLSIPGFAKSTLEKYVRRGGFLSLIVLGVLVAMVELPCTGGIYLAILSLIADAGVRGVFYLILYNVIFVLPLILISYFVYRGAKVDVINGWVQRNKRFMRLAAGVVMVFLGLSLLGLF